MSTTCLIPLHVGKGQSVREAFDRIIGYVENPGKTENGKLISSYQCTGPMASAEFLLARNLYIQKTGRTRRTDDVIAYHIRQSFVPGEITPEEANRKRSITPHYKKHFPVRIASGSEFICTCQVTWVSLDSKA